MAIRTLPIRIQAATILAVGSLLVLATAGLSTPPPFGTYPYHRLLTQSESWKWAAEAWTGDDAPYRAARAAIDQAANSKDTLAAAFAHNKAAALKDPNNPLAVFRWGYAAYLFTKKQTRLEGFKTLEGLHDAFEDAPSPHAYDYDRLRFLVEEWYTSNREATALGQRLLTVNKDDYDVEYRLAAD